MDDLFNVFWFDPDGNSYKEREFIPAKEAVQYAHSLTTRPGAAMGAIKKVMITDMNDFCVFLWENGKLVFPRAETISPMSLRHDH